MDYLHERGVKGYVAMNILLFDEELERAEETIRVIAASNADAVIVQVNAPLCCPARVACSPKFVQNTCAAPQAWLTSAMHAQSAGLHAAVLCRILVL